MRCTALQGDLPKLRETAVSDEDHLIKIRDKFLETENCGDIATGDLFKLYQLFREYIEDLFAGSEYAQAREYMILAEQIADELATRGKNERVLRRKPPQSPPTSKHLLSRIQKFDEETVSQVTSVQTRHEILLDSYMDIWEKRMKVHYFSPSKKLQELRQRAIDLTAKGRQNAARRVLEQAEILEQEETELAQRRYQEDFDRAQARLAEKQDHELECLMHDRLQKRKQMLSGTTRCRSQSVSRNATPRVLHSPIKKQPLQNKKASSPSIIRAKKKSFR